MACERLQLDIVGALVEVLCGIVGRRAEEYDARRPSRGADFSRRFSRLTLMGVAREIRAAGAGTKRAAR
jgi:hypothetical protein